ncbi:MAG: DNA polymerase III subunit alpha [Candidatus Pacebacteria bacterium]|nr:DNA polymerase III subunit alpha [Candidatus Paceibacterota bacterium]
MFDFVHLHTHSHYSLLGAVPKIKPLVKRAKEYGMNALALTDNGNLYGAIEFYDVCTKNGIKPIIGVDAYLAPRGRKDQEHGVDETHSRLVLLAENNIGYNHLIKLVTSSYMEGLFGKPRMDREILEKWHEGLIAIIPSASGEHLSALRGNDFTKATQQVTWYTRTFGVGNVFLELSHHPEIEGHEYLQTQIKKLAVQTGIPLIAAQDTYYLEPEDRVAREVMIRIQNGGSLEEEGFHEDEDRSFISPEKAGELFKDEPEALANIRAVADRCIVTIELGHWYFPDFKIASGRTADDELHHLAIEGMKWRGLPYEGALKERLDYELEVITTKGYAGYFLAVGDLLREARERNILTTIRGSVAGSLTTYAIGITNVDPIKLNLPFERFLNPHRPSAPDIDMDYADNRRDEMIEYAKEKYGHANVAQIGTFGTMMARAVVRDVARALGYPYGVGDKIAKAIPFGAQGFPMTIDIALETEKEFATLYKKDKDVQRIVTLAKKIEGCARHVGVHAAGVVIAPGPLNDFVPVQPDPKGGGKLITQYDMHGVGEDGVGLLKFDFLGIKNLSILADAITRVKDRHGVTIDIENIPLDDTQTYEMLARGDTGGVFQLNGTAMTRYLKELKPTRIEDINAMIALYRPGPMKNIPEYIARKQGRAQVRYFHPKAKKFLEPSFGILVYQDDLLFTALELAGYNWETVDKFRKAVGKKIPEEMAKQHIIFVDGCQKHSGMSAHEAERVWELFEPFQGYGFNKAHAASYGKVAYQTAYMKAHWPVEYMSAILTADSGDIDKVSEAVTECARMGIRVLKPDVNESFGSFTCVQKDDKDAIRFGLTSIKNFGEGITQVIIDEREKHGRFENLTDFLTRIKDRNLNKKSLEALIMCGALDSFEYKRGRMLKHVEDLLTFNREQQQEVAQASLFGDGAHTLTLPDCEQASMADMLAWEKELLGLYVSGHPLDAHKERLTKFGTVTQVKEGYIGIDTSVAGILTEVKPFTTKKGDKMAFMKIADYEGSMEVVAFPSIYAEHREILVPNTCVAFKGKVNARNGEKSFVVDKVKIL